MSFLDKDLLLTKYSGSVFVESKITPVSGSVLFFNGNRDLGTLLTSSLTVNSASYAVSSSYASEGGTNYNLSAVVASEDILKGEVVETTTALSGDIVVRKAVAKIPDPVSGSLSTVVGIASQNITSGSTGNIITQGYLSGLNTSTGFSDGDILYVSSTISGSITSIRPLAPKDKIKLGYVSKIDGSAGRIFVDIEQPKAFGDLSNFSGSLTDGAFMVYDAATGNWSPRSEGLVLSGSLSASNADVNSLVAGTILVNDTFSTLNATVQNNLTIENDLTVARDVVVERTLIASGSVTPFRVASVDSDLPVLYVTGSRVGVGRTDPQFTMHVSGSFAASTKSFVIDHATQPGKALVHATLEGPEHAVFVRGRTDQLVIDLPDYWEWLVDESTISVNVSAVDNPAIYYIKKVKDNKIYMGVTRNDAWYQKLKLPWFGKKTDDYYYLVHAERKDVDKLRTVIKRR